MPRKGFEKARTGCITCKSDPESQVRRSQAVLAISLFYEKLDQANNPSCDPVKQECIAINHYNRALRQTATTHDLDVGLALFLSVLFACIECLRDNNVVAISHCRHAVQLLQSCKDPPPEIPPIIRHLSIFPFCFGTTSLGLPHPNNAEIDHQL
ncbi:hypothetical protein PG994_006619 [Apiospora phragmitis]|uniref:Uncharacterized protein n=1 Tax=Apiospora phragmitis TaxID=2905665 RepID=A0ABR1VFJ8_9PEZI